MKSKILAFAISLLASLSAHVRADIKVDLKARLDAVAQAYTPNGAFMGVALVARGDDILLDRGYGKADLEWELPNAPDVKFRIGSLTKQFTAALILMLQEDGKLMLSDPINKYISDVPKSWASISIAQLLGHVSGIPNFTDDKRFPSWRMSPHTLAEELAFIEANPLKFEPGSQFEYSNSNYELLGAVIEKISGHSYSQMLNERIFQPLGMTDTGLDSDELILAKRAQGYQLGASGLEHSRSESLTVPWAAGSMYSTSGDLLRWERGLFGGKLISNESLKLMTTPGKGDYGLGLMIGKRDRRIVIDHGGSVEGFNTYLACEPELQIVVVVLSNVNGIVPEVLGRQLLDVTAGKPVVLVTDHQAMPISARKLGKFEGAFLLPSGTSVVISKGLHGLTVQIGSGGVDELIYEGSAEYGHANFYDPRRYLPVEFLSHGGEKIISVVLHYSSGDQSAVAVRK